jgi:hypothetical protein
MDADSVCALLHNMTVLFSGDSLVRDQFTALGLWILHHVDGVFDLDRIVPHHARCMTNHWKMLDYSGTTNMLKDAGVQKLSPMSFTVCHGNVVLR